MRELAVGKVRAQWQGGTHRVSADVDGVELFFESPDIELKPSVEAIASSTLIAAQFQKRKLVFDEPIDPKWLTGAPRILPLFQKWWKTALVHPEFKGTRRALAGERGVGVCFSGGVDSFYTLLKYPQPATCAILVHGFDIPLNDVRRFEHASRSAKEVADALGIRLIRIRTNFREVPFIDDAPWSATHGGGLAATGHLLNEYIDHLVISSSYTYGNAYAWGSRWDVDPAWSSSGLRVVHFDAGISRSEKLGIIGHHPLMKKHLRVCWENRTEVGNCSECEKCLRTMLVLASWGLLEQYETFDLSIPLAKRLDETERMPPAIANVMQLAIRRGLPPEIAESARRLVQRSPGHDRDNLYSRTRIKLKGIYHPLRNRFLHRPFRPAVRGDGGQGNGRIA